MAPDPALAVHLAEGVVQHHVGGARRIGARVVADHRIEAVERLDERALEPVVEVVARRLREQVDECAHVVEPEPPQPVGEAGRAQQLRHAARAETCDHVRRRLQHETAQHVGDRIDFAAERRVAFGVLGAELGDFRHRAALAGEQVAAVEVGQKILHAPLDDAQPVLMQREVADDFRVEQPDGIGRDRVAESRMEFLRDRRAAHDRPALHHLHLEAGLAEIGGAGQPVVAGADDDGVIVLHHAAHVSRACRAMRGVRALFGMRWICAPIHGPPNPNISRAS